jgi:hypothetical protein
MSQEYTLNLNQEEIQLILESLLFSSSVDVNADWFLSDHEELLEIAKKVREKYPKIQLKNVYILGDAQKHDEHSEEIVEIFPEVIKFKETYEL